MKKLAIAFAGLAALGFSGAAFAEDGGWTTTTGPAALSDSEMDKVTAGTAGSPGTPADPTPGGGFVLNQGIGGGKALGDSPPDGKGAGTSTLTGKLYAPGQN
jgi:hypothetical protein